MKRYAIIVSVVLFLMLAMMAWLPRLANTGPSKFSFARTQLQNVAAACSNYSWEYGQPPVSLRDLTNNPRNILFMYWGKSGTNDGWGRPIHFKPFDASLGYGSVTSYGRDGRAGGTGPDADIEVRFTRPEQKHR